MVTERVTGRPCFLVEHWLFIQLAARRRGQYASRLGGSAERAHGTPGWMSTLLGPEEAAASLRASYLERPVIAGLRMEIRDTWFRPYLENYTVDASIFWRTSYEVRSAVCM